MFISPKQGGSNKNAWELSEMFIIKNLLIMKKLYLKTKFGRLLLQENSKSIKRKNIVKIKGKELILYSFNELKKVKNIVHKVITSTDDEKLKRYVKN